MAFDLYFSCNSPKISSYSPTFSFTCSDQPSNFKSNGSNLLFKNSNPVIQARSIFPWNFTLFCLSRSSICVSYSPFISAYDESIEYRFVSCTPFCSSSSSFLRSLNFSFTRSSFDNCGVGSTFASGSNGISLNFPYPSHVREALSVWFVDAPKLLTP